MRSFLAAWSRDADDNWATCRWPSIICIRVRVGICRHALVDDLTRHRDDQVVAVNIHLLQVRSNNMLVVAGTRRDLMSFGDGRLRVDRKLSCLSICGGRVGADPRRLTFLIDQSYVDDIGNESFTHIRPIHVRFIGKSVLGEPAFNADLSQIPGQEPRAFMRQHVMRNPPKRPHKVFLH